MPGTLYVVATPIGNLEDVTARALRTLKEVALIAAEDTRRTAHLLDRYGITTPTTSLHEHNEAKKAPAIIERLVRGESVALVSDAGTPLISDPGGHLIRAAIDAGVRIEPVPGPSAIVAALSAAGVSTNPFTFLGFPPIRLKDRKLWFGRLAKLGHTAVFFESPHRIRGTLTELAHAIGNQPIVVCRELTKAHESLVRGPIMEVASGDLRALGELTVVVELGLLSENVSAEPPSDEDLATELGEMTNSSEFTRRKALAEIARRHQMTPNQVYDAVERFKKLAK
jgi:16S rRNA (cytidine1402-2'-O)-methyltransferase